LVVHYLCASASASADSPENIYHKTVKAWQSRQQQRDWNVWMNFKDELLSLFHDVDVTKSLLSNARSKLEIVGAMEEGILVIEKATVEMGEGIDVDRDVVLSHLYTGYGKMLSELNSQECHNLALDPHTLLIGAETVSRGDEPKRFLCIENAENALRNAVTLDATNTQAEELLEQITGKDTATSVHERKPKEFVAELFDSFADSFDEKLNSLEYKVPKLVGNTVQQLNKKFKAVLDAGCGTGLAGRFVRPFATDLMVGVDASQKMLTIAGKCTMNSGCGMMMINNEEDEKNSVSSSQPLYESLIQMDLEDMTVTNTLPNDSNVSNGNNKKIDAFDLVIAADVLVYFGSLANILQIFANVSLEGGHLIFSCERATEEEAPLGWRLLSSGRFAHTKRHVLNAASMAGYHLVSYEHIVPRMERGEEVKGHLFTFELRRIAPEL